MGPRGGNEKEGTELATKGGSRAVGDHRRAGTEVGAAETRGQLRTREREIDLLLREIGAKGAKLSLGLRAELRRETGRS